MQEAGVEKHDGLCDNERCDHVQAEVGREDGDQEFEQIE